MKTFVFLFIISLSLSACSIIDEIDKEIDWFRLGEKSALKGEFYVEKDVLLTQLHSEMITNAQYLMYEKGFKQGLQSFCQVSHASDFARTGHYYQGQCLGMAHEVQFKEAWYRANRKFMFFK